MLMMHKLTSMGCASKLCLNLCYSKIALKSGLCSLAISVCDIVEIGITGSGI